MSGLLWLVLCISFAAVIGYIAYFFGKEKGREEIRKEVLESVFELISELDNER